MIKHSIIVITYNQQDLIKDCIESILSQSVMPYEVIISDDCSTDNTWSIIKEYERKYPEIIRTNRNEVNLGIFGHQNLIKQFATGDFINCVSGDDMLPDGILSAYNDFIVENNIDLSNAVLILTNSFLLHHDGRKTLKKNFDRIMWGAEHNFNIIELSMMHYLWYWNTGMSKKHFVNTPDIRKDIGYHSDSLWNIDRLLIADEIFAMNVCGYIYRMNVGVTVSAATLRQNESYKTATQLICKTYPDKITEKIKRSLRFDYDLADYCFTPSNKAYLQLFSSTLRLIRFKPTIIFQYSEALLPYPIKKITMMLGQIKKKIQKSISYILMEREKRLLSICIPTYNRAAKLDLALEAVVKATINHEDDIEILVSDNCSDDGTKDVVIKYMAICKRLYYFRNESNIGFNFNMINLVDIYAIGKYCWIIGDDDYVDHDSLDGIINKLKSHSNIKYLSLNFRISSTEDYLNTKDSIESKRSIDLLWGTYGQAIDSNASAGNILATFMSSSIFLREPFKQYSKEVFSLTSWTNYYSTFPNAFIMATLFSKEKVAYINEPLFTSIADEKDWDDKIDLLFTRYIPQMYRYLLSIGVDRHDLIRSKAIIEHHRLIHIVKRVGIFKVKDISEINFILKKVSSAPFIKNQLFKHSKRNV